MGLEDGIPPRQFSEPFHQGGSGPSRNLRVIPRPHAIGTGWSFETLKGGSLRVGKELAEKMIDRSDHDKKGFLRFAFNEEWLNPHLYDLVLNTDKLSIDSAVRMVIDGAKSDGIKACGIDSVRLLGKLALQRMVESAFLATGVTSTHLFFNAEDSDTVRLYGFVNSSEEKEEIERVVKGIRDIKKVVNEIGIVKGGMGGI